MLQLSIPFGKWLFGSHEFSQQEFLRIPGHGLSPHPIGQTIGIADWVGNEAALLCAFTKGAACLGGEDWLRLISGLWWFCDLRLSP